MKSFAEIKEYRLDVPTDVSVRMSNFVQAITDAERSDVGIIEVEIGGGPAIAVGGDRGTPFDNETVMVIDINGSVHAFTLKECRDLVAGMRRALDKTCGGQCDVCQLVMGLANDIEEAARELTVH